MDGSLVRTKNGVIRILCKYWDIALFLLLTKSKDVLVNFNIE